MSELKKIIKDNTGNNIEVTIERFGCYTVNDMESRIRFGDDDWHIMSSHYIEDIYDQIGKSIFSIIDLKTFLKEIVEEGHMGREVYRTPNREAELILEFLSGLDMFSLHTDSDNDKLLPLRISKSIKRNENWRGIYIEVDFSVEKITFQDVWEAFLLFDPDVAFMEYYNSLKFSKPSVPKTYGYFNNLKQELFEIMRKMAKQKQKWNR